jgi:hypothetical protein
MTVYENLKMFHVYFNKFNSQTKCLEKHGFYFVASCKEEALKDFAEYAQSKLGESLKSEDITVEEQVMDDDIKISKKANQVTISCS